MATEKKMTALRLNETLIDKVKYIAWYDRTTQTDIIEGLMKEYVIKWEKKNGEITEKELSKLKT